jgi:hypothetical protein
VANRKIGVTAPCSYGAKITSFQLGNFLRESRPPEHYPRFGGQHQFDFDYERDKDDGKDCKKEAAN